MSTVTFDKVTFGYDNKQIFSDFSFVFNADCVNVVMGDSGVGKSTLLRLAMGLNKPSQGHIYCPECSVVFQESRLVEQLTVFDNIDIVLHRAYPDKKQRTKIIVNALQKADILQYAKRYPQQLSGGQRRRAALLRAFLYPSQVMLLDEPFRGLDNAIKQSLAKDFLMWYGDTPKTVIFVTHDVEVAMTVGDYIYKLQDNPANMRLLCDLSTVDKQNRDLYSPYFNKLRQQLNNVCEM